MEHIFADARIEKTAEANACQAAERVLRASVVQFHAVCGTVHAFTQRGKGKPLPAAGIKQVDRNILRKHNPALNVRKMLHFRRVIAHFDTVHQPADHGGIDGIVVLGKFFDQAFHGLHQFGIVRRHNLERPDGCDEFPCVF